jgi:hypothetical protein
VPDLQALSGCTTIHGNLTLRLTVADLAPLAALEHVSGTLVVDRGVGGLHGLESLTTVGGDLNLFANVPNTDPLSSLASIGGVLLVEGQSALTTVRFPKLATAGDVYVQALASGVATITDVELPALEVTKGDFGIYGDTWGAGIVTLAAPALVSVGGSLSLQSLALGDISGFGALKSVGGDLQIYRLSSLTQIGGFGSLTQVGGTLSISHCGAVATVTGFQALTSAGALELSNLPSLSSFGFASLATVGSPPPATSTTPKYSLTLDILPALGSPMGLKALRTSYQGISLTSLDTLTSLGGLDALTTLGGDLFVVDNHNLTTLQGLDAVTSIGGLVLIEQNNALKAIGSLNAVTTIGAAGPAGGVGVQIEFNGALATLNAFNGATQMLNGASILVDNDNALVALDAFGKLQTLGGKLDVSSLPKLKTLAAFGSLTSADALDVESDPLLPTCQANAILTTLKANGFKGTSTISGDGSGTCP